MFEFCFAFCCFGFDFCFVCFCLFYFCLFVCLFVCLFACCTNLSIYVVIADFADFVGSF